MFIMDTFGVTGNTDDFIVVTVGDGQVVTGQNYLDIQLVGGP